MHEYWGNVHLRFIDKIVFFTTTQSQVDQLSCPATVHCIWLLNVWGTVFSHTGNYMH